MISLGMSRSGLYTCPMYNILQDIPLRLYIYILCIYMILIPVATYMIICWKAICQPSESYSKFTSPTMMIKNIGIQATILGIYRDNVGYNSMGKCSTHMGLPQGFNICSAHGQ